jgi:hypothetical protein
MNQTKKMWTRSWSYGENLAFVGFLLVGGFLFQLFYGPFDFYLLRWPVNLSLALVLLVLVVFSSFLFRYKFFSWLGGRYLSVSLILFILFLSLIMGITPQFKNMAHKENYIFRLGLAQMTTAWPFVLIYAFIITNLALTVGRRLYPLKTRNIIFLLNHLGLWLVLLGAGLGAADHENYIMHVPEGQIEWRVYSGQKEVLELPLALRLDDFIMEEYPPKLLVIERETGLPLPKGRPDVFQFGDENKSLWLNNWNIEIKEYLEKAVPEGEGRWRSMDMPASAPAVLVEASRKTDHLFRSGWISSGNGSLPVSPLILDDSSVLVMAPGEPKSFSSKVKAFTKEGLEKETVIEVNHPLKIGPWIIYQYGYDNEAGRLSSYSSFQLVLDRWLKVVYTGFVLWLLGSLGLIFKGKIYKDKENDLG